jgi:hypothetical protein
MRVDTSKRGDSDMKNKTQVVVQKIKNHVSKNKYTYYMGAVAVGAVALQQKNVRDFTKFMIEKNIDPNEYFCPELIEENANN